MSRWRAWCMAARPATLPAAAVPVVVGSALALADGRWRPLAGLAALVSALLIQIGTNFANDLFDYRKGADTSGRLGPTRVTQAGLLAPKAVAVGTAVTFGSAFAVGLYLVHIGGWPILAIGLAGIAAGVLYTAGPWPYGYHGLGELFVFVFFGLAAVIGTYYVHTATVTPLAVWTALPIACLVTGILVVNNLRDIDTDRAAGKRTLAVRLGERPTRWLYAALVCIAYVIGVGIVWLPIVSAPLAWRLVRDVLGGASGPALNGVLSRTGRLELVFGLLMAIGYTAL
ncbi:MAG TPA: 1,4-dihydroxy-2-naphthoate polyprenyltransferase [Limnochordia bacterium]